MTTQLLSDLKSKVRILHEFEHKGKRYRACLRNDSDAVWVDRYEPGTGKWEMQPPLVDEDAELVIQLARLAGRMDLDAEGASDGPAPIGACPTCGVPIYTEEGFCGSCGRR